MLNQLNLDRYPNRRRGGPGIVVMIICAALFSTAGCEKRVISATGIGARDSHPQTYEASPRDRLSDQIWGEDKR